MSKRVGTIVIIAVEKPRKCQICGTIEECRPYGPNGEDVCFDCCMKNRELSRARRAHVLFGVPLVLPKSS